jgi:hypothetical protein
MAPTLDISLRFMRTFLLEGKTSFLIASLMEDRIASVTMLDLRDDAVEDKGQHQHMTIVIAHFR